jgi:hypothetical protein
MDMEIYSNLVANEGWERHYAEFGQEVSRSNSYCTHQT